MLPIYSEKNERFILKILLDCKKKKKYIHTMEL